ncbi:MAG: hypothetical protein M3O31_06075 [Acidobacteriota bacterium]|nr:hypothetical protein [Acidobacteriota bacterium]
MSSASTISTPVLTPQDAIASHVRWKIALQLAAQMREPLSERATRTIEHPEECNIHKWLLSENTRSLRNTREYVAVLEHHTAFHGQMLKIENLLRAGDFDQAERLLTQPSPFQEVANALANAIMALGGSSRPASPPQKKSAPQTP